MTSEEGLGVICFQARYAGGGRGTGDVITALWHAGGCFFRGWCLIVPAASVGAGIERLNLQQGRFHLDIKKKLFSSKGH